MNFWERRYHKAIQYIKQRPEVVGYFEKHHILPRSLGGDNSKDNIIKVSAREHFILHFILHKWLGGKMSQAFWIMVNANSLKYRTTSKFYESARKESARVSSIQNSGSNNPMYGKRGVLSPNFGKVGQRFNQIASEETRKKISKALKGYKHSIEFCEVVKARQTGDTNSFFGKTHTDQAKQSMRDKLSGEKNPNYGKSIPMTEQTKKKISDKTKGKPKSEQMRKRLSEAIKGKKQNVLQCPHCGKTGGNNNMKRYHMDNCGSKK